jgi:uncharacterized damage-inducible protein DinB
LIFQVTEVPVFCSEVIARVEIFLIPQIKIEKNFLSRFSTAIGLTVGLRYFVLLNQTDMDIIQILLKELDYEADVTRKMLSRIPADKLNWKPHEKSMDMKTLAVHIAELPGWVSMALTTSELDFAKVDFTPTPVSGAEELLEIFEKSLVSGKAELEKATEADLEPKWTMRNGDQIYSVMNKYEVIRHSLNQTTHHRAQLGVYLRLLNIPIPGSYGPSADEMNF